MSTPDSPPQGGDQNKAPMLRAVLSSELAVAAIIVALRFFSRIRITRSPGVDDWTMLATIVRCSLRYELVKNMAPFLCTMYHATSVDVRS